MKINVVIIDDLPANFRPIKLVLNKYQADYVYDGNYLEPTIHSIEAKKTAQGKLDDDAIINEVHRLNPAVAIVDMRLEGDNWDDFSGVDLSLKIQSICSNCCIILVSAYLSIENEKLVSHLNVFRDKVNSGIREDGKDTFENFENDLKEKFKNALFTHFSSINYRGKRFSERVNNKKQSMWGLVIGPGQKGIRIEPQLPIPYLKSNSLIVELIEVGICGTDKRSFGKMPPPDYDIIEFHEAFGKVVWTGEAVRNIKIGDYVIPMVRRCECWDKPEVRSPIKSSSFNFSPCKYGIQRDCFHKADQCPKGEYLGLKNERSEGYKSRGTGKCHGFGSQYFIDTEEWLIRVKPPIENKKMAAFRKLMMKRYILTEPLSIVWKMHREITRYYNIREFDCKVLIIGQGPIGLLALTVFNYLHPGLHYTAIDLADTGTQRVKKLKKYYKEVEYYKTDQEDAPPADLPDKKFDIIIEATGQPEKIFKYAPSLLASRGILVLLGVSEDDNKVDIDSAAITQFVKKGNILIGSINSARADFEDSVNFMEKIIGNKKSILDDEDFVSRWEIESGLPEKIIHTLGETAAKDREEIKIVLNAQGYTQKIRNG